MLSCFSDYVNDMLKLYLLIIMIFMILFVEPSKEKNKNHFFHEEVELY